ncbi:hypothetical protein [Chitinimonas lacunae]|uniref:Preprotein translocase subunit SecD n=1 Tax=Chitinimonas lacunae TaxID=1963018 RepID=A0ABV8MVT8_9NEIS
MKPHELLPDQHDTVVVNGSTVRKGSVGAFLVSWRLASDPAQAASTREEAKVDLLALVPALAALGLFEVLTPRDPQLAQWVQTALADRAVS